MFRPQRGCSPFWARRHLAANWSGEISIKVDHELIQSGQYRVVRHPIYTGILGIFGATVVGGRYQTILGLLIVGFAYGRKSRLNEASLRNAFGAAYDAYRNQAEIWIPKLMRGSPEYGNRLSRSWRAHGRSGRSGEICVVQARFDLRHPGRRVGVVDNAGPL